MDLDILRTLTGLGANVPTMSLLFVSLLYVRVARLEKSLNLLVSTCVDCPRRNKHKLATALTVVAALLLCFLLSGCVATRVRFADAEMTRTALLTHIEVPNIEVNTNGSFKASILSDPRTDMIKELRLLIEDFR